METDFERRGPQRVQGYVRAWALATLCVGVGAPAWALGPKSGQPPARPTDEGGPKQGPDAFLERVGIEQKLGEPLPAELEFQNSAGETVRLGDLFQGRPVVLSLVYYECPMLCTMVLNGMLRMLNVLQFDIGQEFDVITVSIDPRETPALAARKKKVYLERYRREGAVAGWHFLVGDEANVTALAEAVGYAYAYDEETDQFAHGSAIMIATPEAKIAQYFYGIDYSPVDVRLSLVEASTERIGSLTDAILLSCFQYNPLDGRYSLAVMRVIRLTGILTVFALVFFILFNLWRDRARRQQPTAPAAGAS